MKRFVVLILLLGAAFHCAAMLCAQEGAMPVLAAGTPAPPPAAANYDRWPSSLGLFGSSLAGNSGGGLQYQRWFGRLGFAVTAGGTYHPETLDREDYYSDNLLYYSGYVTLQYRVFGSDYNEWLSGDLYLWVLGGHIGYITVSCNPKGDTNGDGYPDYALEADPYVGDALAGVGIGIEFILFEHFSVPVEFGYVGQFPHDTRLDLAGGGGLRYRY